MIELTSRKLTLSDSDLLVDFFRQCSDFALLTSGFSEPKKEALSALTDLPEGKELTDKHVLGFFDINGQLVAVADLVQDFPTPGEMMLGLLEILPHERSNGLGAQIHAQLIEQARLMAAKSLRIAVYQDNPRAANFWRSLGYQKIKETTLTFGSKTHKIDVMRLILGQ